MQFKVGGTGPLIALLAIVSLGAIAFAIPAAPIEAPSTEGRQGCLIGHSALSDLLAEQLAATGYHYIAVDLGSARLEDDSLWTEHLDRVSSRLFPVWGWVDVRSAGFRDAQRFIRELNLAGMYVYGPDAVAKAEELRSGRAGFEIVPVLRDGDPAPADGRYAVALDLGEFWDRAEEFDLPVLRADVLDANKIEDAREVAGRNYVVALTPLKD
jgi:hypothetical protein